MTYWFSCLNCHKIKQDYKCVKYSCGSVYCVKCDNKLKK